MAKILKINNEYEAFCIDETSIYLYGQWENGGKTYLDKWKAQSLTLGAKIDKTKKKKKTKVK